MTCFGGEWFDLWNVFAFAFSFVFVGPICLGPESFGGEWCDLWNVDIYLNLHLSERGNYICDREQPYVHLHLSHSAKIRSGL